MIRELAMQAKEELSSLGPPVLLRSTGRELLMPTQRDILLLPVQLLTDMEEMEVKLSAESAEMAPEMVRGEVMVLQAEVDLTKVKEEEMDSAEAEEEQEMEAHPEELVHQDSEDPEAGVEAIRLEGVEVDTETEEMEVMEEGPEATEPTAELIVQVMEEQLQGLHKAEVEEVEVHMVMPILQT
jgi:hypothetical protein